MPVHFRARSVRVIAPPARCLPADGWLRSSGFDSKGAPIYWRGLFYQARRT